MEKGLSAQNLHILAEVGKCATGQGEGVQHIIGGDFNMQPEVLATSGIDQLAQATIVFPKSSKGTYRSGGANSCLDYFIVSDPMAECVEGVATEELTGLKGHVPVSVCFAPQLTAQKVLRIRKVGKGRERRSKCFGDHEGGGGEVRGGELGDRKRVCSLGQSGGTRID